MPKTRKININANNVIKITKISCGIFPIQKRSIIKVEIKIIVEKK